MTAPIARARTRARVAQRPLPAAAPPPASACTPGWPRWRRSCRSTRQLNRRITELVDVVAELLVPIADRDEERVHEVLAQYRASI